MDKQLLSFLDSLEALEMGIFGSAIDQDAKKCDDIDIYLYLNSACTALAVLRALRDAQFTARVSINSYGTGPRPKFNPTGYAHFTLLSTEPDYRRFMDYDNKAPITTREPKRFEEALKRGRMRMQRR